MGCFRADAADFAQPTGLLQLRRGLPEGVSAGIAMLRLKVRLLQPGDVVRALTLKCTKIAGKPVFDWR
jgi:hypothetical protein